MSPAKPFLVALLSLTLAPLVEAQAGKDWSHHTGKLPFVVGYEAGVAQARKEHKPVMLFITTTWCGWCKKLAAESFADEQVIKALEGFVPVIADGDEEHALLETLGVHSFPDVRFLSTDGKELGHVGGYVSKSEFLKAIGVARQSLPAKAAEHPTVVYDSPEEAKGLASGDSVPALTLKTAGGEAFDLIASLHAKPTVLIFYRGGWCPFCNKHLAGLQTIEAELRESGYQLLAISPDLPEGAAKTTSSLGLGYTLISDTGNVAAKAFKLAFRLDASTVEKYQGMGLDLTAQDWTLPVPAAFVVGQDGRVVFAHVSPDYKQRIDGAALLEAAKRALSVSK